MAHARRRTGVSRAAEDRQERLIAEPYLLRQAARADIGAIHAVRVSVLENRLTRSIITERDYIDHLENFGRGWVIDVADRIVAVAIGNARNGNIWGLFVHPDYERRGFGRRLLNTAVHWLSTQGQTRLWLTTAPDTRAQGFYEAAGWIYAGTTEHGEIRFELSCHVSPAQSDLFGASPHWPGGLTYTPDFIDTDEERGLLQAIRDVPMHDAQYYEYTAKRRVASFGASYDFELRHLHDAAPVPEFLIPLRRRLADLLALPEDSFAQTLITEYRAGTPLGWHRDALNYELIAGVSLGGRCRMRFRPYPPRGGRDPKTFALELAPRSLYIMRDAVRWHWQHTIPATPEHRWSVTFRTLRNSQPGS